MSSWFDASTHCLKSSTSLLNHILKFASIVFSSVTSLISCIITTINSMLMPSDCPLMIAFRLFCWWSARPWVYLILMERKYWLFSWQWRLITLSKPWISSDSMNMIVDFPPVPGMICNITTAPWTFSTHPTKWSQFKKSFGPNSGHWLKQFVNVCSRQWILWQWKWNMMAYIRFRFMISTTKWQQWLHWVCCFVRWIRRNSQWGSSLPIWLFVFADLFQWWRSRASLVSRLVEWTFGGFSAMWTLDCDALLLCLMRCNDRSLSWLWKRTEFGGRTGILMVWWHLCNYWFLDFCIGIHNFSISWWT